MKRRTLGLVVERHRGGFVGSRIHVGDVLTWSEPTPGLRNNLVLRCADASVATFRRVHRIGSVVAEGEFLAESWRLEQRGLVPARYILTWLHSEDASQSQAVFVVSGQGLKLDDGPMFTYVKASADSGGGWRRDDGPLLLEWNQREAMLRQFTIAAAGAEDPQLPELMVITPQFELMLGKAAHAEYLGQVSIIDLLVRALLHFFGR